MNRMSDEKRKERRRKTKKVETRPCFSVPVCLRHPLELFHFGFLFFEPGGLPRLLAVGWVLGGGLEGDVLSRGRVGSTWFVGVVGVRSSPILTNQKALDGERGAGMGDLWWYRCEKHGEWGTYWVMGGSNALELERIGVS